MTKQTRRWAYSRYVFPACCLLRFAAFFYSIWHNLTLVDCVWFCLLCLILSRLVWFYLILFDLDLLCWTPCLTYNLLDSSCSILYNFVSICSNMLFGFWMLFLCGQCHLFLDTKHLVLISAQSYLLLLLHCTKYQLKIYSSSHSETNVHKVWSFHSLFYSFDSYSSFSPKKASSYILHKTFLVF